MCYLVIKTVFVHISEFFIFPHTFLCFSVLLLRFQNLLRVWKHWSTSDIIHKTLYKARKVTLENNLRLMRRQTLLLEGHSPSAFSSNTPVWNLQVTLNTWMELNSAGRWPNKRRTGSPQMYCFLQKLIEKILASSLFSLRILSLNSWVQGIILSGLFQSDWLACWRRETGAFLPSTCSGCWTETRKTHQNISTARRTKNIR